MISRRTILAMPLSMALQGCSSEPDPCAPDVSHGDSRPRVLIFAESDAQARAVEARFPLDLAGQIRFQRERNNEYNRAKWRLNDHGPTPLVVVLAPGRDGKVCYRGPFDADKVYPAVRKVID